MTTKAKSKLAELIEAEQELRETAERQITNMEEEAPEYFITQEELDECPDYDPLRAIDDAVKEVVQLAKNIESDAIDWGEGFKALVRARAK